MVLKNTVKYLDEILIMIKYLDYHFNLDNLSNLREIILKVTGYLQTNKKELALNLLVSSLPIVIILKTQINSKKILEIENLIRITLESLEG